jgi:hypothetical protein
LLVLAATAAALAGACRDRGHAIRIVAANEAEAALAGS